MSIATILGLLEHFFSVTLDRKQKFYISLIWFHKYKWHVNFVNNGITILLDEQMTKIRVVQ
jgi:hypothetical protein